MDRIRKATSRQTLKHQRHLVEHFPQPAPQDRFTLATPDARITLLSDDRNSPGACPFHVAATVPASADVTARSGRGACTITGTERAWFIKAMSHALDAKWKQKRTPPTRVNVLPKCDRHPANRHAHGIQYRWAQHVYDQITLSRTAPMIARQRRQKEGRPT